MYTVTYQVFQVRTQAPPCASAQALVLKHQAWKAPRM